MQLIIKGENSNLLARYSQQMEKFVQLLNVHGINLYCMGISDLNPSAVRLLAEF
jgi:hypothetical protein